MLYNQAYNYKYTACYKSGLLIIRFFEWVTIRRNSK